MTDVKALSLNGWADLPVELVTQALRSLSGGSWASLRLVLLNCWLCLGSYATALRVSQLCHIRSPRAWAGVQTVERFGRQHAA